MRKNVASQKVGAQLVSAADGSAFTGSVTVAVTVDAGTQATGSVGSGACTHEGNGYHSYAPAQAETNGNLIAFTFTGSGAIPVTVQVYTESLDPHDTVRMGLTALPNAAAEAAGGLYTRGTGAGQINQNANGQVDTRVVTMAATAVQAIWDALTSALTTASSIGKLLADNINATISSRASQSSVDTIDDFLDTEIATLVSNVGTILTAVDTEVGSLVTMVTAVKVVTDALPEGFKKNTAFSAFPFFMVDSADHLTGKTGLTVTAQRSLDGGAFGACANAVAEIGNGWYKLNLAAGDLNGDSVILKFTAIGADATGITIKTKA